MVARVEFNKAAFSGSMRTVSIFAVVSIVLALVLGYGISVSLIGPVRTMEKRMREIAAGDFSRRRPRRAPARRRLDRWLRASVAHAEVS